MPLNGPATYLPTADAFIAHWTSADAELGAAGPIVLAHAATLETLRGLRAGLESQRAVVERDRNALELARLRIESLKTALLARLNQFNLKLASLAPESPLIPLRPKAYSRRDGLGKVLPPLDDLADLWSRHHAASPGQPLTLMHGYSLADFSADLASLRAAHPAWCQAKNTLTLARASRTRTEKQVRAILLRYRQCIAATFPETSLILQTLPPLTPPPGPKPDPVSVAASWDPGVSQGKITFGPSADPALDHYELRHCPGSKYTTRDEIPLASIPAAGPREFLTLTGLASPGARALFRVYVLTSTGKQRGSRTVRVTRPAG